MLGPDATIGFGPEDEPSPEEITLRMLGEMEKLFPAGLCANKDDHFGHPVLEGSLAPFWCTAIQSQREPFRSEQRRRAAEQAEVER